MISVVIPASGVGARLGASVPKQFLELGGVPILRRTIAAFEQMDIVENIAVAVPRGYTQTVASYGFLKLRHIVEGGTDRTASVYAALKALPPTSNIVLIHDAVRPFVDLPLVKAVAEAAKVHGAAIACTPVTDTIKQADTSGKITVTLDRSQLWQAQTPQGFTYDIIKCAHAQAQKDEISGTDDSLLVERLGLPVYIVPSSPRNIKITTPEDMVIARGLLNGVE